MTDIPTTWRSTPAGANDTMRQYAAHVLRRFVDIDMDVAMHVAAEMWDAMSRASPAPPPVSPWMPIESAPKDGAPILIAWQAMGAISTVWPTIDRVSVVAWKRDHPMPHWQPLDDAFMHILHPTHWQPLPDRPAPPPIEEERK